MLGSNNLLLGNTTERWTRVYNEIRGVDEGEVENDYTDSGHRSLVTEPSYRTEGNCLFPPVCEALAFPLKGTLPYYSFERNFYSSERELRHGPWRT